VRDPGCVLELPDRGCPRLDKMVDASQVHLQAVDVACAELEAPVGSAATLRAPSG
jgi:hypothetical protein